jgi:hypothetical protein
MLPPEQAQYLEALQSQQAQGGQTSPIASGSQAALESVMNSRRMNDDQRRRALGMAVMEFSKNHSPGNTQPGWQGALANVAQSLTPAVETYLREQQQSEIQNMAMQEYAMKFQRQQQMDQMAAQRLHDLNQYRERSLALRKESGSRRPSKDSSYTDLQIEKYKRSLDNDETNLAKVGESMIEKRMKSLGPVEKMEPGIREKIEEEVATQLMPRIANIAKRKSHFENIKLSKPKENKKHFSDYDAEIDNEVASLRGESAFPEEELEEIAGEPELSSEEIRAKIRELKGGP